MEEENVVADVGGGGAVARVARPEAAQQLRLHRVPAHLHRRRELRAALGVSALGVGALGLAHLHRRREVRAAADARRRQAQLSI